ncbi:hypothetical protein DACRYDRAFT_107598 [Dacryopinax primogenitus]|uniref:Uncharacterized protein n=1 Tax=Dacryopinax primogenitus (strain DJM 731) TaxID=1858805 RepID=M5GCM5_DACPD|nr:uncharacterized protein DACRYDRAFT_107598 [Dacryopinax primogenitus]EJU01863.1 hypothetical protein DACRYDRAFT_107598 [Dacryopinax primogenitus]
MPLLQETKSTPSPPLYQSAFPTPKSEMPLKRVRLQRPHELLPKRTSGKSPRSLKSPSKHKNYSERQTSSSKKRLPSRLGGPSVPAPPYPTDTSQMPRTAADPLSPSCWRYSASPFHELLREEYTRFWLPWRMWAEDSPTLLTSHHSMFLAERVRASDWVEQMFESWFLAGYGYRKTHSEYLGMDSD